MKTAKTIFCVVLVLWGSRLLSLAADSAFIATDPGDVEVSSYQLNNASHVCTNACADYGTNVLYRVLVTRAEQLAGWAALPQSRKDAAKAAAANERADMDAKMDKLIRAFAIVMLDEINILRVKSGLAPRTTDQLKQAVKAKYQAMAQYRPTEEELTEAIRTELKR